jgi:uncharacterized protein (TIGR02145 family)
MKKILFFICLVLTPIIFLTIRNGEANSQTVKDIDGNVYKTVTIGTQIWMAENLRVTKYRDGTPIPMISDDKVWGKDTTGAYCFYNNDASNAKIYGVLYNGYAILNPKKITPSGWHIPSDDEWEKLINYLGGEKIAGGKLKEKNSTHWHNNVDATNQSGFTALPGGCRHTNILGDSNYDWLGLRGFFASSTEWGDKVPWFRELQASNPYVNRNHYTSRSGLSVRCVKD